VVKVRAKVSAKVRVRDRTLVSDRDRVSVLLRDKEDWDLGKDRVVSSISSTRFRHLSHRRLLHPLRRLR
jgi:hypothetical protein